MYMETLKTSFVLTPSDLRRAAGYASVFRNRRGMTFCSLMLLGIAVHSVGSLLSLWPPVSLIPYLSIPFFAWILVVLGTANLRVLRLIRTSDAVNVLYHAAIDSEGILLSIPDQKSATHYEFSKLSCIMETRTQFLFYITPQDMFLIPKRALSNDEIEIIKLLCNAKLMGLFLSTKSTTKAPQE